MSKILVGLLQCGSFILIPGTSFGIGLWLIISYVGFQRKLGVIFFALLMGLVLFEASVIGMIIDPRSGSFGWTKLIGIAGLIGTATSILVLAFSWVYANLIKNLRR